MPFTTEYQHDPALHCPNCGERTVRWRRWESYDGGVTDTCYSCDACRHLW